MNTHAAPTRTLPRFAALPRLMAIAATSPPAAHALHECHDCGLFQTIGELRPGQVAACERCGAVLRRRRRNSLSVTLALSLTGMVLMILSAAWPLLDIRLTGQDRAATLMSLPGAFEDHDMPPLAIVMAITTLVAPAMRLALTSAVLLGLRSRLSRQTLVAMARLRHILTPWAMLDVFLLGLFVAYTRLGAIATVEVGLALYALLLLMLITAWSDAWLDEDLMWEAIAQRGPSTVEPVTGGRPMGCDACRLVSHGHEGDACPRCGTGLRHRRPQPIARAWALLLTGAILYIPANVYPVLTVIRLGKGAPSTIIGGVVELVEYKMVPLAILVLVASIIVPLLKLAGLSTLLVLTQRRSNMSLLMRTRLYRIVDLIGRWSMIDVFMVGVLTALVRMGVVASVTPGYGAMAFCAVVILTMLASMSASIRA